ncbi:MAG: undecaprenyl/decaprenyl-phosphate alpha-N-acetylglucosaminyl 1-phosphate transferase [Bacteroidia bacterium]|nr:undecaprenyl/decaprenyl-phosphate alpha-N-acetylglucosaminyl 1-phosphate transferase [Bacteroidia bacterium]
MAFVLVALGSLLSVWVWNEIFLRFARRLGALSQGIPNQRRWDSRRKPIIGGIGFFVVALGLAAWRPADLPVSHALLAGAVVAFLTGLADDAFVSVPHIKLLGQLAAATVALALEAPRLELGNPIASFSLTLFWYVAVMNAFNMMDNMDGISGSLAFSMLIGTPWLLPQSPHVFLYVGLAGAILAFLYRNWHPSHLYMGDNGSQFLGFVLAYWGTEVWEARFVLSPWANLFGLISLFALLAGDTFWVILSRLVRGVSPFNGGTDHLTHRLAQRGWPVRWISLSILGGQATLTLLSIFSGGHEQYEWLQILVIAAVGGGIGFVHLRHMRSALRLARMRQTV